MRENESAIVAKLLCSIMVARRRRGGTCARTPGGPREGHFDPDTQEVPGIDGEEAEEECPTPCGCPACCGAMVLLSRVGLRRMRAEAWALRKWQPPKSVCLPVVDSTNKNQQHVAAMLTRDHNLVRR